MPLRSGRLCYGELEESQNSSFRSQGLSLRRGRGLSLCAVVVVEADRVEGGYFLHRQSMAVDEREAEESPQRPRVSDVRARHGRLIASFRVQVVFDPTLSRVL